MYRNNFTSFKAINSWLTIYDSAIELFRTEGYHQTSVRMIARKANCSVGLFHRYFSSKEEIVLALYEKLSNQLEERLVELPKGTMAQRFTCLMHVKFELILPYEKTFGSILGFMLDPNHPIGGSSRETEVIRLRNITTFRALVNGSKDKPKSRKKVAQVSKTLYGLHFLLIFLWLFDKKAEKQDALDTLATVEGYLKRLHHKLNPLSNYFNGTLEKTFSSVLNIEMIQSESELSRKILQLVFHHRKVIQGEEACLKNPCEKCHTLHLSRIDYFIRQKQPIHFVLPAFPAKSPNADKVLGKLPDLGEEIALTTLQGICNKIQDIYAPGASISICADGRVFSDLVQVSDGDVSAYTKQLKRMIKENDLSSLNVLNLEDLIKVDDFDQARTDLVQRYAQPLDYFETRKKDNDYYQKLFNGTHRFILEDQKDLFPEMSKTQFKNHSKVIATKVMQRSDAWGSIINDFFPYSLRLSIHPHHPHAVKIGINLTKAADNWITPWHGVVILKPEEGYVLAKKSEAVELGAELVYKDEQPHYYALHG